MSLRTTRDTARVRSTASTNMPDVTWFLWYDQGARGRLESGSASCQSPRGVQQRSGARSDALCEDSSSSNSRSLPNCACAVAQSCHNTGGVKPENCDSRLPYRFIVCIGRSFAHTYRLYRVNADPDCHRVVYHRLTSGPVSVARRRRDEPTRSCPHASGSWTGSPESQPQPSMWR